MAFSFKLFWFDLTYKANGLFKKLMAHPLKKTWDSEKFTSICHCQLPQDITFFGYDEKEDIKNPIFCIILWEFPENIVM